MLIKFLGLPSDTFDPINTSSNSYLFRMQFKIGANIPAVIFRGGE